MRLRRHVILQPEAQRRVLLHAGIDALQPAVPPALAFLQEADGRAGNAAIGIQMAPGPGDALAIRPVEVLHQPEHRRRIAVGPAADREDGGLQLAVILADRAMPPEGVAALMLQPLRRKRLGDFQPLEPLLLPARPDHLRIRRHVGDGEERAAPIHVVAQEAAAHVMHIVVIAVDGGAHGDHGLQRRRLTIGGLQSVEAAPGDADHPHIAAAPGLLRQPGDDVAGVVLFLLQIFVMEEAVGIAAAADIHAGAGIAVRGEPAMHGVVAQARAVAAPVGNIFKDRRHRRCVGPVGNPQPRRQPPPVGHRNPLQLDFAELAVDVAQNGGDSGGRFRHWRFPFVRTGFFCPARVSRVLVQAMEPVAAPSVKWRTAVHENV